MNSGDHQNDDMSDLTGIMNFLLAFKPLECSECKKVLGFLVRKTGKIFCAPSSSEHGNSCFGNAWQKTSGYFNGHSDIAAPIAVTLGDIVTQRIEENVPEVQVQETPPVVSRVATDKTIKDDLLNWSPLTPEEEKEMAGLLATNEQFRVTKENVESVMRADNKFEAFTPYVYRLDNAEFIYGSQDLPVMSASFLTGITEFEITQFNSLETIVARPITKLLESMRNRQSEDISNWMKAKKKNEVRKLRITEQFHEDEMCLIEWPVQWENLCSAMGGGNDEDCWWTELQQGSRPLNMFLNDYKMFSGKWYRAAFITEKNPKICQMFLVDFGISTLIPKQNIYKMPHRFMIEIQMSCILNVKLDGISQFSDKINEKWKYLFRPGLKIKARPIWMFDEFVIVKLVYPSEKQFDKHFSDLNTHGWIERLEKKKQQRKRHKIVQKLALTKGSYPKIMKQVIADEAKQQKEKEKKSEYVGLGRVAPDLVFELALPHCSCPYRVEKKRRTL